MAKFFIIIFILIINQCYSASINSDSSICLLIKGKVHKIGKKTIDTFKVELIYFNTLIKNDNFSVRTAFQYHLMKNSIYTIRISKQGFVSKIISINTNMPVGNNNLYQLQVETELIEEINTNELDKESLEFPATIIQYDKKANWFYINEDYTTNIKRSTYNLKALKSK